MSLVGAVRKKLGRYFVLDVLVLLCVLYLCIYALSAARISPESLEAAKKSRAHLGCKGLSQAAGAYETHPSGLITEPLRDLGQLVHPPGGVPPFLRNGDADLIDPWGRPYEMERRRFADGKEYPFIFTRASDGTLISQFGIGPTAELAK